MQYKMKRYYCESFNQPGNTGAGSVGGVSQSNINARAGLVTTRLKSTKKTVKTAAILQWGCCRLTIPFNMSRSEKGQLLIIAYLCVICQ